MKITLKCEHDSPATVTTYEILDHVSLPELMQEFRCFLLAIGFQPGSVIKYIEAE